MTPCYVCVWQQVPANARKFEYALGQAAEQAVLRIGPYLGTPWAQTAVRLYVQTRVATMVQLYHQGVHGLDKAFVELINELVQLGTPIKIIEKILLIAIAIAMASATCVAIADRQLSIISYLLSDVPRGRTLGRICASVRVCWCRFFVFKIYD